MPGGAARRGHDAPADLHDLSCVLAEDVHAHDLLERDVSS